MLNLKDGTLWQWDTGRKIIVTLDEGHTIYKVQFYNGIGDNAFPATSIETVNGEILAGIPNSLLCYAKNLTVYLMTTDEDGVKTQEQITLVVNKRAKPEDYIYTDDEIRQYAEYDQRLAYVEDNMVGLDDVQDMLERTEALLKEVENYVDKGDAKLLAGLTPSEVGASGARNLLPYPHLQTTKTQSGITWTDNGDGTVTAKGTNTLNAQNLFDCRGRLETTNPLVLKAGTYTVSGCPSGAKHDASMWYIQVATNDENGNFSKLGNDYGNNVTFTLTEDTQIQIQLVVRTNDTVDITFKPMLEVGKVAHDFVPYHFGGAKDALTLQGMDIPEFVVNENLLPNPDFDIHSGETDATGWDVVRASLIRNKDGSITITRTGATTSSAYIRKIFTNGKAMFIGKTVTASFEDSTGTKYEFTFTMDGSVKSKSFGDVQIFYDDTESTFNGNSQIAFGLKANSTAQTLTIKWLKLEIGSVATPFAPPNTELEKIKCGVSNSLTVYKSLAELGLDESTVTVESIVNAMADNSMLLHKLGSTATSAPIQFPYNYSMFKVTKLTTSYVLFECIGTGNLPIYYAYYNGGSSNKWSGWSTQFLPLTGGKVTRNATMETIQLERTDGAAPGLGFYMNGARVGILHTSADGRVFRRNGDLTVTAEMLDTANSAKLLISETTLTAEGSVRVW